MKKMLLCCLMLVWLCSVSLADTIFAFELPEYEVLIGKQVRVKAVAQGIEGKLSYTWSSSDTSIATVSNGLVTGKGAGKAVITCTASTPDGNIYEASCTVAVIKPISSIKVEKQKVTLAKMDLSIDDRPEYGEEPFYYQAVVTILPEDATNKTLKWSSSDRFVALVDDNGMVHTWGTPGTSTIKAEATDGSGRYATFTVTVPDVYVTSEKIIIDSEDGIVWGYQLNASGISSMNLKDNGAFYVDSADDYGGIDNIRIVPLKEGSGTIIVKSGKTQKNIPVTVKSSAVRSDKTYPPHKVSTILADKDKYIGAKVGISNASGADIQLVPHRKLETYKDDQKWDNAYNSYCGYTIMKVQENDLMYFAVEQRYPKNLLEKENVKIYGKIVGYTTYVSPTGLEYECPVLAFPTVANPKK